MIVSFANHIGAVRRVNVSQRVQGTAISTLLERWGVEYRSGAVGRSVGKTRMVAGLTSGMAPDQAGQSARTTLGAVDQGRQASDPPNG